MYAGSELAGDEELPGPVDHVPPQVGGCVASDAAKPLNDDGAASPLGRLLLDHWAPQKVTVAE